MAEALKGSAGDYKTDGSLETSKKTLKSLPGARVGALKSTDKKYWWSAGERNDMKYCQVR